MMNFLGSKVIHGIFGEGIISFSEEDAITVRFGNGEKKFIFPDSFVNFLTFEDPELQKHVEKILGKITQKQSEENDRIQQEKNRLFRLRNLKIALKSQGIFGLIENSAEEIFTSWSARSGRYLSGYSKGKPRIPAGLAPNSACLFTELPPGAPEKERRVIGAFMVKDDFEGRLCTDGLIEAHEKFRIKLNADERPLFWDYFKDETPPPSWGNVEIRYCPNLDAQKILYDICKTARDGEHRERAELFYRYFCAINRLSESPEEYSLKKDPPRP